jgi:hypothetical protein
VCETGTVNKATFHLRLLFCDSVQSCKSFVIITAGEHHNLQYCVCLYQFCLTFWALFIIYGVELVEWIKVSCKRYEVIRIRIFVWKYFNEESSARGECKVKLSLVTGCRGP